MKILYPYCGTRSIFGVLPGFRGLLLACKATVWQLALGTLLLVLSPRQFAGYYNDKDAVFLALCIIAVATMVSFIRQPT
jgi:hypothetical protein